MRECTSESQPALKYKGSSTLEGFLKLKHIWLLYEQKVRISVSAEGNVYMNTTKNIIYFKRVGRFSALLTWVHNVDGGMQ